MNPLHHHGPAKRNPYFPPQHQEQPQLLPHQQHHGYHPQAPPQSVPFGELEDPSTPHTSASSNLSPETTQLDASPARGSRKGSGAPPAPAWNVKASKTGTAAKKARRVRTGCLTCRKRHLKCDEGTPDCSNCMKGNRTCERGLRLNFLDIQVKKPPYLIPHTRDWSVQFQDESRLIASEYRGGLKRYPSLSEMGRGRQLSTESYLDPPRRSQSAVPLAGQLQEPPPFFSSNTLGSSNNNNLRNPSTHTPGPRDYATSVGQPPPIHNPVSYESAQPSLPSLLSHRNSEQFEDTPMVTSAPPSAFTLVASQEPFTMKEEPSYPIHRSRRNSDSSVASSLIPEATGQSFQSGFPNPQDKLNPLQASPDGLTTPSSDRTNTERDYLSTEDEIRFMQVFIDEVTIWMDTLNKDQHFANTLPYLALKSSMLLNACLACGVKRLSPTDERGGVYYDTATTQVIRSLQNPDRNTSETAITAVVLNVYETMMDTPTQRLHHIAGARALIRECGWDAKSTGLAAACFWLNVGLEVLTCLSQNWKTAWEPDEWGMDLEFTTWIVGSHSGSVVGSYTSERENHEAAKAADSLQATEELWTQRIFYIMAKVVNFRATIPRFQEPSPHDEQVRLQSRFAEWNRLKALLDAWNHNCPRSMQSFGYSLERSTRSVFPNIWLLKRTSTTARIFYQTCMTLLPQLNPMATPSLSSSSGISSSSAAASQEENLSLARHHARQVCGMVAHTSDRGVFSVAIRALAVAGAVLDTKAEQDEVLALLDRINRETGWKLVKVQDELVRAWEVQKEPPRRFTSAAVGVGMHQLVAPPVAMRPGQGHGGVLGPLVNPLLVNADFGKEGAPYKNFWVVPNRREEERREEGDGVNGGGVSSSKDKGKDKERERERERSFGGLLAMLDENYNNNSGHGNRGGGVFGGSIVAGGAGGNRDDNFGFGGPWPR
ncbi:putative transcription factor [Cladorrhinum sp. PSN259]|nr:putative transcription factor [Cladorrhinum sp. PSN259]